VVEVVENVVVVVVVVVVDEDDDVDDVVVVVAEGVNVTVAEPPEFERVPELPLYPEALPLYDTPLFAVHCSVSVMELGADAEPDAVSEGAAIFVIVPLHV
jgi:hypothetical protein